MLSREFEVKTGEIVLKLSELARSNDGNDGNRAMAKPCAGRSLSIARTVRSASDSDGPAVMILSVVGAAAVRE